MWAAVIICFALAVTIAGERNSTEASNEIDGRDDVASGCSHSAPGLDLIARGVDVTKLDLFHDYSISDADGFANRLIDYHCVEGKTWTSPFDGVTYQVPDEIDDLVALSAGIVISNSQLMFERNKIKKSMSEEVGIDLTFDSGAFSASQTFKSSHYKMEQSKKVIASDKAYVSIAQATLAPSFFLGNSSLSKYVRAVIDMLPDRFDSDSAAAYLQFFQDYGTHYFHRGNLGGSLSTWFELDENLFNQMDNQSVSNQVKASFLSVLKDHGAYSGQVDTIDDRFKTQSTHTERYYGGQANLFDTDGYKKWWPSIAGNPWLHSGSLVPVTQLLPDSHAKKSQLMQAYKVYLDRAYATEVMNVIQAMRTNPVFSGVPLLGTFETKITDILARDHIPDMRQVTQIEKEVVEYKTTPAWFRSSLICLQFDGYAETCVPAGQVPPFVDSLDHCPGPREGHFPAGHIKLKASTPEGGIVLQKAGASFDLTNRIGSLGEDLWIHVLYTGTFRVNTAPEANTPGWLRGAQLCWICYDNYNKPLQTSSSCAPVNTPLPEVSIAHKFMNFDHTNFISFYIRTY